MLPNLNLMNINSSKTDIKNRKKEKKIKINPDLLFISLKTIEKIKKNIEKCIADAAAPYKKPVIKLIIFIYFSYLF